MFMPLAVALLLALAALFIAPADALAQTVAQAALAPVDFAPVVGTVLEILAAGLLAIGMWAVNKLAAKLKLDIEARHREALYAALAAGINYAKNKIAAASEGRSALNIQNDLARFAAQYAVSKVPDAVRHFGLSPERVQELVRARLPS